MTDANNTDPGGGDLHPGFAPAAPGASSRPEWMPESHWDAATNSVRVDGLKDVFTRDSAARAAKAQLPERPDDYEIALPSDFKVPDGSGITPEQIGINENDPRIPAVRAFAHKHGLSQAAVADLVAFDAQQQLAAYHAEVARLGEENQKLGDKAEERTRAVDDWARGMKDRGEFTADELQAVYAVASTAAGVQLFEKLIGRINGAIPGNTFDGRPQPQPGTIPGYERMSFEQKRVAQWAAAQGRHDG